MNGIKSLWRVIEKLLVIFRNIGWPSDILNIDLSWSPIDIGTLFAGLLMLRFLAMQPRLLALAALIAFTFSYALMELITN